MPWKVWRILKSSGRNAWNGMLYSTEDEALAVIKKELEDGYIECADMEDLKGNRIGWLEIKKRLGLP